MRSSDFEEKLMKVLMKLSLMLIVTAMLLIIFSIVYRGMGSLSWEMISSKPGGGYYYGKSGGILNAIAGSLYLACGAAFLALAIGLPVALFINVNLVKFKKTAAAIRFLLDLLWGIPSIVYGAFGFTVMIFFGLRTSLLAGILTVTLFILPIMIRAMDEVLRSVPRGLLEAGLAMGARKRQVSFGIYVRQALPGIITAFILSFGRAIGDAAAVLFTAGYTDHIPTALTQPAATLPLAIFFQLGSPFPEVQNRAYAAAVILTFMVLAVSVAARYFSGRSDKNKIKF
jgi:phosphate transport system permease protein